MADRPAIVASSAFTDVLKLLTKVFDTVVIDAPPVLKASEATMIVRHADAAVLVVRQGVTTEQQVEMAIDELSGTELLGVILNRSSTSRAPAPAALRPARREAGRATMKLLLAFMFGVVLLSIWEVKGGPKWRTPVVVAACAVVALAFSLERVL